MFVMQAFALTGRKADCAYTQGVTLGWELLPFQGVRGQGGSGGSGIKMRLSTLSASRK